MMDAKKEVTFTMGELKELLFQLDGVLKKLEIQEEQANTGEDNRNLKEKKKFLQEIRQKLYS